jgi:transposase
VDAKALATLLRGNFVSTVHVPGKEVRQKKNTVRQRLWLARVRTMVRNRIHTVLDRHPRIERPAHKDPFCNQGKAWMKRIELPQPDRQLLDEDLELHELLDRHIRALEDRIENDNAAHADALRLRTLPGVGKVLGPVIALEIDGVSRFKTADRFCAYAGLVPTTHSSGGKTSHGRMLPFCNRWLKWAFIEAAWVSIGCSDYFGCFYKRHRADYHHRSAHGQDRLENADRTARLLKGAHRRQTTFPGRSRHGLTTSSARCVLGQDRGPGI